MKVHKDYYRSIQGVSSVINDYLLTRPWKILRNSKVFWQNKFDMVNILKLVGQIHISSHFTNESENEISVRSSNLLRKLNKILYTKRFLKKEKPVWNNILLR